MINIFHYIPITFMAFFAIMNPLANLPIFFSLTASNDRQIQRQVAKKALVTAFILVTVFSVAGKFIFDAFGIGLPAFRIAGGILIFVIGFHMLNGSTSPVQNPGKGAQEASKEQALSVAITPLAMPLLAGPGTIATAINLSVNKGYEKMIATIIGFFLLCVITYILFRYGANLTRFLGKNFMTVITKLMGLILAVIGVQMIIAGVIAAFPILNSH